jgi:CRP-like cAMP-binding protein
VIARGVVLSYPKLQTFRRIRASANWRTRSSIHFRARWTRHNARRFERIVLSGGTTDTVQDTNILRGIPLFAGLASADLAVLGGAARVVRYPAGSIVFQEGDEGDYVLVLTKGKVKVTLLGDDGSETVVNELEPPAVLGEIALLDGRPRSATVIAVEPTEFLKIARQPLLDLIRHDPSLALRMMVQLARALRRATEQVRSLAMFDVHGRILRTLLMLAQQRGAANRSRITIRPRPRVMDLALMCGCTRYAVGRALKELARLGYVTLTSDTVVIESRAIRKYLQPSLEHIASPDGPPTA